MAVYQVISKSTPNVVENIVSGDTEGSEGYSCSVISVFLFDDTTF